MRLLPELTRDAELPERAVALLGRRAAELADAGVVILTLDDWMSLADTERSALAGAGRRRAVELAVLRGTAGGGKLAAAAAYVTVDGGRALRRALLEARLDALAVPSP